ncbi:uncharacterized protein FOMMEDRAFT_153312 [Fomitiporia mediterranea MF3/22]|uniref:uncharacterized protein n=1 Tax=Fomitiporia mediterranea (strain MF3/22) TaxID=694068 RepID=UPI0004409453|nr:uncharacterized protein FOMMEDRAFT_153312 [Fomitiporia mediterranea MF3/22]EJD05965.1 hypothetical protein FOMMEDRAFT_153312 [Fomitiporia mediterranea MF3/22]
MGDSMQDAIKVLQSMSPIFDPTEDYLSIVSAEEQMGSVATQRQKELDDANNNLKDLLRTLDTARAACTRPPTVASAEAHAESLNALDGARLGFMKRINATESALAEKEAALARLREECAKLEASDPATEHELDASTLKLTFIRGLGFTPITDKNGHVQKILVRSQSGEVHSVSFDDDKSNEKYANLLWNLASS